MAKLKTDSLLSRRIARAFLEFLDSVEPAAGVDFEGLEVARECLTEAFKLDSSSTGDAYTKTDSLIDIFSSLEGKENQPLQSVPTNGVASTNGPSSSSARNVANDEGWSKDSNGIGASKDELFGQFFAALEKIHFFRAMPDGNDDPIQLDKATRLFHDAINEMEKSGCQTYNRNILAEALKSQGNRAMQSKLYSDAIELYSISIALCENNAVYYCNRAAAHTQINKCAEAIRDCLKSVEIDPNYSKAYSRLGLAYYAQGNYSDAIEKGFKKALELDPNNDSVKENIRVAEQKLKEQQQWPRRERDQNTSSSHDNQESQSTGGPTSHGVPPSFASMPFPSGLPADIASMVINMVANATQGQPSESRQGEDSNVNGPDEPGIRMGGSSINFNFAESMPDDLSGALRSMMEVFSGVAHGNSQDNTTNGRSGAAPHGDSQGNTNGRPAGN